MATKKKKDVKELKQTHGAVIGSKSVFDFGLATPNRYDTTDAAQYTKQLEGMSLADLQHHSIHVAQIRPGFDRLRLINALERRFNEYMFQAKMRKT